MRFLWLVPFPFCCLYSVLPSVSAFSICRRALGTGNPRPEDHQYFLPPSTVALQAHNNDNGTPRTSEWQSIVSTRANVTEAINELLQKSCGPQEDPPDLAFLFVSQYHASNFASIVPNVYAGLNNERRSDTSRQCRLLSVVGSGVIGDDQEWDEPSKPALSLMVGRHVSHLESLHLFDFNELHKPPPPASSDYWTRFSQRDSKGQGKDDDKLPRQSSAVLVLADPWSPVERLTSSLPPETVVAGGISCPTGTGPTVAIDGSCLEQGSLVGICLPRGLNLQIVTSQGCRPIENDRVRTVTAAEGSVLLTLDDQPALSVLEGVVQGSAAPLTGIVCGIQAQDSNERNNPSSVESDDYLIRQIVGFVPTKGGIAVPGSISVGDRFRFFVRDNEAAQQDLQLMLRRAQTERAVYGQGLPPTSWVAAWQFSCVARGRRFFGARDVDLEQTKSLLPGSSCSTTTDEDNNEPPPAVAGFFANGELGPVGIAGLVKPSGGGSNAGGSHIHGFTTVVAYLCDTTGISTKQTNLAPVLSPGADDPSAWG